MVVDPMGDFETQRRQWMENEARLFWERVAVSALEGSDVEDVAEWADQLTAAWKERFLKPAGTVTINNKEMP